MNSSGRSLASPERPPCRRHEHFTPPAGHTPDTRSPAAHNPRRSYPQPRHRSRSAATRLRHTTAAPIAITAKLTFHTAASTYHTVPLIVSAAPIFTRRFSHHSNVPIAPPINKINTGAAIPIHPPRPARFGGQTPHHTNTHTAAICAITTPCTSETDTTYPGGRNVHPTYPATVFGIRSATAMHNIGFTINHALTAHHCQTAHARGDTCIAINTHSSVIGPHTTPRIDGKYAPAMPHRITAHTAPSPCHAYITRITACCKSNPPSAQ